MSEVNVRRVDREPGDEPITEQLLLADLLGFAEYLSEAVATDGVHIDLAGAELAEAAVTDSEKRALHGAAAVAATRLGDTSLLATLLRSADERANRANVA
jgi:hypothetical protein